ncbi:ATP-dependent DNA helicase [Salix suchowensis]|nr:ATP-dependent DNA helicase [Salix suchowensis]KAG5228418.1 ATP-dependent DNA helicase [Salix suchowensis]
MPDGQLLAEITNKLLREELNYDLADLRSQHSLNFASLNNGQRVVYDSVVEAIFNKKQVLIFVHGHGGTGGRTAHSRFKIPLAIDESSTCAIKKNSQLSSLLQKTSLIVWDEAPMNNKCCFEALDRSMHLPFGGKTILLGGDFRQILPVIPGGTKEQIINASLTSSTLWPKFTVLTLEENMRLSTDGLTFEEKAEINDFSKWILSVGDGDISNLPALDGSDDCFISIPSDLLLQTSSDLISTMVSTIYPDIHEAHKDPCYFRERAIVTTKNTTVDEINDFVLHITPGEKHIYLSVDSISTSSTDSDNANSLYPIEYINQLEFNGVPSHALALKIGAPVMLLRNISPSIGLCNGTRLIVTQLSSRVIEAQIITGSNIGNKVFIPRIIFPINEARCPFTIKRRQFPLRPCYAMTINKSQGQSLKIVGVFLKEQVFTHGQLYVALSRVTSKKGLKIISCDNEGRPSTYAKNIVYKDIISALAKGFISFHY